MRYRNPDVEDRLNKDWQSNWEPRINAAQEELKRLTDDESMARAGSLTEVKWDSSDFVWRVAALRELRRRARSACWFWKRWRRPDECHRWLNYMRQIDKKTLENLRRISST